jgi:peptide-methionine (S)-S-oxide reductase
LAPAALVTIRPIAAYVEMETGRLGRNCDDREQERAMLNARSIAGPLGGAVGVALVVGAFALMLGGARSAEPAVALPAPALGEAADSAAAEEKVVLAGGCFWGVQAVFQHVKGVKEVVSGYAGSDKETAAYEQVSSGRTGHAESVEVTFDPHVVSYGTILQIYFSVAHNPTEFNRQGPDSGSQYRSEIFAESDAQKRVAEAYIAQLAGAKAFSAPIVTRVEPLRGFYPAEAYHQNYATLNPENGYIASNDAPKVENLWKLFPDAFRQKPKLVAVAGGD